MIDDIPFLVTCPIDMYAKAGMTGYFSYLPYKAKLARRKTLDYLKTKSLRKFCLMTQLLTGKGMASSSADIAAVCQITALSVGKQLTECEIAQIAASIEPTDGVFCKGIVRLNHLKRRHTGTFRSCTEAQNPHVRLRWQSGYTIVQPAARTEKTVSAERKIRKGSTRHAASRL